MPFLFGYGSLISRKSAAATCQREVAPDQHRDAALLGYKRIWQLVVPALVGESFDQPIAGVFLDITPSPHTVCAGSIFEVTSDELLFFDRRERQYERVDITDKIFPAAVSGAVYTYVGQPEFTNPTPESVVLKGYEKILDDALAEKSDSFRSLWKSSTEPHEFKRLDGPYRFGNPDQQSHSGR